MVCCCESCSHYSHYDDRLYDSLSGILQYDMIAYYLFATYVICGSVMIGKLDWGGLLLLCSYFDFTDCFFLLFFVIELLLIGVC